MLQHHAHVPDVHERQGVQTGEGGPLGFCGQLGYAIEGQKELRISCCILVWCNGMPSA